MQAEVAVNRGGKSGGVFSYKVPVGASFRQKSAGTFGEKDCAGICHPHRG